jgi:hypothetical protein
MAPNLKFNHIESPMRADWVLKKVYISSYYFHNGKEFVPGTIFNQYYTYKDKELQAVSLKYLFDQELQEATERINLNEFLEILSKIQVLDQGLNTDSSYIGYFLVDSRVNKNDLSDKNYQKALNKCIGE